MPNSLITNEELQHDVTKNFALYVIESVFQNRFIICQFFDKSNRENFNLIYPYALPNDFIVGTQRRFVEPCYNIIKEYRHTKPADFLVDAKSYSLTILPLESYFAIEDYLKDGLAIYARNDFIAFSHLCNSINEYTKVEINPEQLPLEISIAKKTEGDKFCCFRF